MLWVCDEALLKFHLKNACNVRISVQVKYLPVNRGDFVTNNYTFKPGETGYLFDTKNRYVYATGTTSDGRRWEWFTIDMGPKLGKKYTHVFSCQ